MRVIKFYGVPFPFQDLPSNDAQSNCCKEIRTRISILNGSLVKIILKNFLIAAKCILLNNSASFQHFSFKLGQKVELV